MLCGFIHDVVSSMRIHEVEREEEPNFIDRQEEVQLIPPVQQQRNMAKDNPRL